MTPIEGRYEHVKPITISEPSFAIANLTLNIFLSLQRPINNWKVVEGM